MGLKAVVDKLKESCVFRLEYEGRFVGLRVKWYNVGVSCFEYYDFTLRTVQNNHEVRDFVNGNYQSFGVVKLLEHGDLYMSEDEIAGRIVVQEFKDEESAVAVLRPLMLKWGLSHV